MIVDDLIANHGVESWLVLPWHEISPTKLENSLVRPMMDRISMNVPGPVTLVHPEPTERYELGEPPAPLPKIMWGLINAPFGPQVAAGQKWVPKSQPR